MMKYLFASFLLLTTYLLQAQDTTTITNNVGMRLLYPVLWEQSAAEYRALCYQAFNAAAYRLEKLPRKIRRKKNLAIITDIDETILDNSYFEAQLILNNKSYSDSAWQQWVSKSAASTVPGAVQFLQTVKQKGIHVFYISNRDTAAIGATLVNLKQYHLPDADSAHLLFKNGISSKEKRRQTVEQKYNVIMLLGDNLADFTNLFEQKNMQERFVTTDSLQTDWGKKFIVLPNPMYGDWEGAFYNYQWKLTDAQKLTILMHLLKGFVL